MRKGVSIGAPCTRPGHAASDETSVHALKSPAFVMEEEEEEAVNFAPYRPVGTPNHNQV